MRTLSGDLLMTQRGGYIQTGATMMFKCQIVNHHDGKFLIFMITVRALCAFLSNMNKLLSSGMVVDAVMTGWDKLVIDGSFTMTYSVQ